MEIGHLGEFGLIERLKKILATQGNSDVLIGPGDDAAAIKPSIGFLLLSTADAFIEDIHFIRSFFTPHQIGKKAVTVSVSDIAAMGGIPENALLSLGFPEHTKVKFVEGICEGVREACEQYGVTVIGGNLSSSKTGVMIHVTILGKVREGRCIRRSSALPGDCFYVTGTPGEASAGKEILQTGKKNLRAQYVHLVSRFLEPVAPVREGRVLGGAGYVTSMIDISDGLASDLGHICKESGVGALVYQDLLPISDDLEMAGRELNEDPYRWCLVGGEDYQLLFTVPRPLTRELVKFCEQHEITVTRIGTVTEKEKGIMIEMGNGKILPLELQGFDHFESRR